MNSNADKPRTLDRQAYISSFDNMIQNTCPSLSAIACKSKRVVTLTPKRQDGQFSSFSGYAKLAEVRSTPKTLSQDRLPLIKCIPDIHISHDVVFRMELTVDREKQFLNLCGICRA